jgi:hypothetical protein
VAWGPVRAAGLAAIAAAVLMMLAAPWFLHFLRGPADAQGQGVAAVRDAVPQPKPDVPQSGWPEWTQKAREPATGPGRSEERGPSQPDSADGVGSTREELVHVREYLDHPDLRHIFLVSDKGDGSSEQVVANVVEQTTRFNYYKITISQGIVIDPRHPDQATVFALVVGPRELDNLRDRLRTALRDQFEEEPAEPGIVTRLADIGHVEACRPSPPADMHIPRAALAQKERIAGLVGEAVNPPPPENPERNDRPTREQERSSPDAEVRDRSLVVLVWVSRPRSG